MKAWYQSKTIRTAVLSFLGMLMAAMLADPDVLAVINQYAAWALPILMVLLRLITKGPVGKPPIKSKEPEREEDHT